MYAIRSYYDSVALREPRTSYAKLSLRDSRTLVASLPKKKSLNLLFAELARQNIQVLSMRNKANRLDVITSYSIHYTKLYDCVCIIIWDRNA